jgi:hypothetical protein
MKKTTRLVALILTGLLTIAFTGILCSADELPGTGVGALRMTAVATGPYDAVKDKEALDSLNAHTGEVVAHYWPAASIVDLEVFYTKSAPKDVGTALAKLAQNFGTNLQIVEQDGEGSFLTIMPRSHERASFYALLLHEGGTIIVIADLVIINKETQG